jgi:hypothetical protein
LSKKQASAVSWEAVQPRIRFLDMDWPQPESFSRVRWADGFQRKNTISLDGAGYWISISKGRILDLQLGLDGVSEDSDLKKSKVD